ncbi:IclR family transcriptional regulator [Ruicaihuangia caeni]|uniref:IclR family transcriptional regulator n=1 Tax=Ruicaihuangia caeni TaxID=3042517 RepID=A0AAW6T3T1_9MICO|nr:IclR family transcriptional regulator [Klugiella sp. YN-L-19]MDI2098481.1 IclR family transcriptional regulator [Klugiella sp. YN-L-19]
MANSPTGDSMVQRVVRVLESFDSGRVSQTASEIARRSQLPTSTAHRIVGELVETGLLERDESGAVRIGLRLWELTTRGSRALGLRQLAMPFMAEVQAVVREHTQLAVLEEHEVLFIERLSARNAGANVTRIAGRLPLHASSSGLVLLAFAPPELQEAVLSGPLREVSQETITDPRRLRSKLAEVRRLGFASAPGFIEQVSSGIAVPVRDGSGTVIAALSVVLPRERAGDQEAVLVLKRAASRITEAIAATGFLSR